MSLQTAHTWDQNVDAEANEQVHHTRASNPSTKVSELAMPGKGFRFSTADQKLQTGTVADLLAMPSSWAKPRPMMSSWKKCLTAPSGSP